jgi:CubicO group peptidase (beta-lactamase class C family)
MILDWLYNATLDYPIGTKSVYSDLSMVALQLVIERVTGKSLYAFVEQEVFIPLGMNNTGYIPSKWSTCAPTLKTPNYRGEIIRCVVHDPTAWILGGISGNAGIFSNWVDLSIFMNMMLNKGLYNSSYDGT